MNENPYYNVKILSILTSEFLGGSLDFVAEDGASPVSP